VESNFRALRLGYDYAREHFDCPLPIRLEPDGRHAGHVI
jgi:2-oxoglutarate/2-oxoacid ferredoxin oxidoreductase subunit alpha